ncbi:CD99 molecule like 2 [Phyllostomus discolor]|uniref:CD99 antigen-like protein 2 n=1 Tax=Phyllostomus discolor TaxID=89673 RepID=A0A834DNI9_9CHIR|nr:CD99 molecule like 2 [Phyllostomus discolor]
MVARRSVFLLYLAFSLVTLVQRGYGDPEDALKENSSVKQRWDHVRTTTKRPGTTTAPAKPAASDFDLADALDGWNDQDDGHRKPNVGGRGNSSFDAHCWASRELVHMEIFHLSTNMHAIIDCLEGLGILWTSSSCDSQV